MPDAIIELGKLENENAEFNNSFVKLTVEPTTKQGVPEETTASVNMKMLKELVSHQRAEKQHNPGDSGQ